MKIRLSFVSNSSASSFSIPLSKLTNKQAYKLINYWKLGRGKFSYDPVGYLVIMAMIDGGYNRENKDFCCGSIKIPHDMWRVKEENKFIVGETSNDASYDMKGYIESIGISLDDVNYQRTD